MIYLINILLIIIYGLFLLGYNTNSNKKKLFCILASLQWILLSGLRDISIGADTLSYKISFERTKNLSWNFLVDRFNGIIFQGKEGKDPGYAFVEKFVQIFTDNYQIYLIIIALIFTIPMGIFIYRYSKNACLSFIIYSTLFFSFFAITGHRQTIVTGVAIFLGYELIKKKKFLLYCAIIILLMTVHKSVICLIPFYFIANKKITFKYCISILILFVIIFIFKNNVMKILANTLGYEEFANQYNGAGTWTFTLLFIVIILVSIWKRKIILKNNNKDITIWYNAMFLALLFIPLTFVDPNAMRLVQYFSIFIIVIIPEIVKSFNLKEQSLIYFLGISILIILLAKQGLNYKFFWGGLNG